MTKSFKIRDHKLPTHFSTLTVDKLFTGSVNLPSMSIINIQEKTPQELSSGILYSNSGVLLYKAPDGTITFIANS
jgi:hypothetical protein